MKISLSDSISVSTRIVVLSLTVVFSFTGCSNDAAKKLSHSEPVQDKWSYQGETAPEFWEEIEKGSDCGGNRQSPINIIDFYAVQSDSPVDLGIHYASDTHINKVVNSGYTVQFDFMPGDSILLNGEVYRLIQIHFHEHAEHLISGVVYPIEIHLVHLNKAGELAVLAVLGKEGAESQIIELLESFLPLKMGESKQIDVQCDLNQLLPADRTFYSYSGSLTTPPCTEGVHWVVFKNPIILSLDEVSTLKSNMPLNNYRSEQPLNGRVVTVNPL